MTRDEIVRYGGRYLIAYALASVALAVIGILLASMSINIGTGGGAAIAVAASSFTFDKFLKDRGSLPASGEYWSLVLGSTVIGVILEALKLALILNLYPALYTGNSIWTFTLVLAAVLIFVINLFFYSKIIGRSYLKRQQSRHRNL